MLFLLLAALPAAATPKSARPSLPTAAKFRSPLAPAIDAYIRPQLARLEGAATLLRREGVEGAASIALAPTLLHARNADQLWRPALARAAGLNWDGADSSLKEHEFVADPATALALFEEPLSKGTWRLNPPSGGFIGNPQLKKRQVKLFPAEFVALPQSFFKRHGPELGIPSEARLFAMILPPEEARRAFAETPASGHLENAFAYVRFYVRGDDLIVAEIQSDSYREIKDRELKARYEHWSRQLLLAFEDYAARAHFRNRLGRIVIAGPGYQQRRWKDARLDEGLTRIVYRDQPSILGYVPVSGLTYAFEWPGHLRPEDPAHLVPLAIEEGFALPIETVRARQGPFREEFSLLLERDEENRFAAALRTLQRAHAGAATLPRAAAAPLPALAELPGINRGLMRGYARVLERTQDERYGLTEVALPRAEAEAALLHQLALHRLMLSVADEPAAAPIPLGLDAQEDGKAVLRIAALSFIRALEPVRLLDLPYAATRAFLESVYRAWNQPIAAPTEGEEDLGLDEQMRRFRRVYLSHRAQAESIWSGLIERSLKTIAAVHGAGGHLGGERLRWLNGEGREVELPVGAPLGGATGKLSLSWAGEMLDLGRSVYLPWVRRPDLGAQESALHRQALKQLQLKDLAHWEYALESIDSFLRGWEQAGEPSPRLVGGETSLDAQFSRTEALVKDLTLSPWLDRQQDAALYNEYYEKGRAFRGESGSR